MKGPRVRETITMILVIIMFVAASVTAQACGCCIVDDPTGTPLNVRDKPGGSIIDTLPNDAITGTYEELKKDNRGRVWALIDTSLATGGWDESRSEFHPLRGVRGKKGWVFYKYLKCG
jgi:hypothetical protein